MKHTKAKSKQKTLVRVMCLAIALVMVAALFSTVVYSLAALA